MNIKFSINTPNIAHESIDGEVVVINLVSGNYYSLDGTGAKIWDLIDRGYSCSVITEIMSSQYTSDEINISDTITHFLSELEQEDLIVPNAQAVEEQPIDSSITPELTIFTIPTVNRYSDMQELLLLDPIHDVDAMGWPKTTV